MAHASTIAMKLWVDVASTEFGDKILSVGVRGKICNKLKAARETLPTPRTRIEKRVTGNDIRLTRPEVDDQFVDTRKQDDANVSSVAQSDANQASCLSGCPCSGHLPTATCTFGDKFAGEALSIPLLRPFWVEGTRSRPLRTNSYFSARR